MWNDSWNELRWNEAKWDEIRRYDTMPSHDAAICKSISGLIWNHAHLNVGIAFQQLNIDPPGKNHWKPWKLIFKFLRGFSPTEFSDFLVSHPSDPKIPWGVSTNPWSKTYHRWIQTGLSQTGTCLDSAVVYWSNWYLPALMVPTLDSIGIKTTAPYNLLPVVLGKSCNSDSCYDKNGKDRPLKKKTWHI